MARYGMPAEGRVGVALSGGGDSVFLLHALRELGLLSTLLHVNHGLRGAESDADEDFVRELARQFDLPCHVFVAPVLTGNTEQEARRLRYQFFREHIDAGDCDAVATGHTLDDQAETVLYRFLRGSGTAGLSGIRPVHSADGGRYVILRPLIELRRDEIRQWLRSHCIAWREDSSNANHEFVRNRIRNRHLPELTGSVNPALPEVLASTAQWAQGEEDYWDAELNRLAPAYFIPRGESVLIRTRPLLALAPAVQRRLLRHFFERVRGSLRAIDFAHVEATRALIGSSEGSGRIQLPDLDIYRSFDWLRISPLGFDSRIPRDFELALPVPGRVRLPERRLTMDIELSSADHVYNGGMSGALDQDALDPQACAGSLLLRNWRPGDHFHRPGHAGPVKIKTLFQEFRIPLWERRTWPVIVQDGQQVVWTRRFGAAAGFAAGPEARNILVIHETVESNLLNLTSTQMERVSGADSRQVETPGAEVL
jgi:tRNA(Ile)-lysidine synthase